MLDKFVEPLLDSLKQRLKARQFIELLCLVLLMALTFFVLSHPVSLVQYLGVTIWLIISLWYALVAYRKKMRRTAKYLLFLTALVGTAGWSIGFKRYYDTSPWRPIHKYDLEIPDTSPGLAVQHNNAFLAIKVEGPQRYHETGISYVVDPRHPEPATYAYDRWYYPPIDTIGDLLKVSLRGSGAFREVKMYDSHTPPDAYVLNFYLIAFDKILGDKPKARVAVRVEMIEPENHKLAWAASYAHEEPVETDEMEDLVGALEKNLEAGINQIIPELNEYFANHPPK